MLSLEEIGLKYGTGKSSLTADYLNFYELLLGPWRYKHIKILEIGVQFGYSLKMWRDYFVCAHIIGIDSVDNGVKFMSEDGIILEIADGYSPDTVARIAGQKFDIIIDDGSHIPLDQKFFVESYSPFLTDEGVLIVEDVLTPEIIPFLVQGVPDKFNSCAIEMNKGGCRLFIVWRKHSSRAPWQSAPESAMVDLKNEAPYSLPHESCPQPLSDVSCSDPTNTLEPFHSNPSPS